MENYQLVFGLIISLLCVLIGYFKVTNKGGYTIAKIVTYAIEFIHILLSKIDNKLMDMFLSRYFKLTKKEQEKLCEKVSKELDFISDNITGLKEETDISDKQVEIGKARNPISFS